MAIWEANVAAGPEALRRISDLLAQELDEGGPLEGEAMRALSGRLFRDQGRMPWGQAALDWLAHADREGAGAFLTELRAALDDPRPAVAHGALLLLIALAEDRTDLGDTLFQAATAHRDPDVRRRAGAYLLSTPRTQDRAVAELTGHPDLGGMARRVSVVQQSMPTWHALVHQLNQPDNRAAARQTITNNPDLLFELENGFLDAFESMSPAGQTDCLAFLAEALRDPSPSMQTLALDIFTDGRMLERARQALGYRLTRELHRLAGNPGAAELVRLQAQGLIRNLESGASVDSLLLAARGEASLTESDKDHLSQMLARAEEYFRTAPPGAAEVPTRPGWGPEDYAHYLLTGVLGEPQFPVPLEELCRRLGIALFRQSLSSPCDGLLLQPAHLPGPLVIASTSGGRTEGRIRFTIAHELGHAVLPEHARWAAYITEVMETRAGQRPGDEAGAEAAAAAEFPDRPFEREADRFAAALLMPRRWFGEAARRHPFQLDGLSSLAEAYGVSLTAAAWNAMDFTREPAALVSSAGGRVLYWRGSDEFWDATGREADFVDQLQSGSMARTLLDEPDGPARRSGSVPANLWLSRSALGRPGGTLGPHIHGPCADNPDRRD